MKLNNHIRQYYDLKCTYETEPLTIDCYIIQASNILFSECDRILNHVYIAGGKGEEADVPGGMPP